MLHSRQIHSPKKIFEPPQGTEKPRNNTANRYNLFTIRNIRMLCPILIENPQI